MKRKFTYKDGKSDKFWSIEIEGAGFTVTYGKTGTAGQTQTKNFADDAAAQKEADKLIAKKVKEGYSEESVFDPGKPGEQPQSETVANAEAREAKRLLDEVHIRITDPVLYTEIEKAEKVLGIKLPPSYIDFVTQYGTFEIDGDLTGRGSGNYTSFSAPNFLAEKTLELRAELEEHYPPENEERKIAGDGLLFCADPMDEFYYVFVISSADESGEMKARRFDYQHFSMNDPWHAGDMTFSECIAEITEIIKTNRAENGEDDENTDEADGGSANANSDLPMLNEKNFLEIVTEISVEEAQEKYHISDFIYGIADDDDDDDDDDDEDDDDDYDDDYIESAVAQYIAQNIGIDNDDKEDDDEEDDDDGQKWCLYKGDLHVASVEAGILADRSYYSLIVDGNLIVDGEVSWWEELGQSLLLVTGNLKCRNLLMGGCPKIVVRGDLIVENGVLGMCGDDGGVLTVNGNTKAKIIVAETYFNMYFSGQPEAVVIVGNGDVNCEEDYDCDSAMEALLPQYINSDGLATNEIQNAFIAGQPILRPTAVSDRQKLEAQLSGLLERAQDVTTLSLAKCKMATIRPQVFLFPNLRELDLTHNPICELPADIGKLKHLEKLTLVYTSIKDLPDEILELKNLKSLDIRNSHFTQIPDIIGQLTSLEELYIESFTELPESLANLTNLKTLFVSRCREDKFSTDQLGKLKSLTKLTLEFLPTSRYSDELLNLTELTYLEVKFNNTPLTYFPDLSGLKKLKTLVLDGYPLPKIDMPKLPIWSIPVLEELSLKSFDDKPGSNGRIGCTELPDAFDGLPNLQRFYLQPSEQFAELPESFFRLKNLKEVSLGKAALGKQTVDKIRKTYPQGVTFHIESASDSCDVNDSNWQKVHQLTKQGAELLRSDYKKALQSFEKALARCKPDAKYANFDKLYSLYGCVYSLANMIPSASGKEKEKLIDADIRYSTQALEMADKPGAIWIFTQEGAFHLEVNRYAGNELGWWLAMRGELDRALEAVERAEQCVESYSQYYVLDTKVRILLKMGRTHEACLIVDRVLTKYPDFGDFQDIKNSEGFQQWQAENS